MHVNPLIILKL